MTNEAKAKSKEKLARALSDELDDALLDTFPASDPVSMTQPSGKVGRPNHARPKRQGGADKAAN